jgi:hypothetical protein
MRTSPAYARPFGKGYVFGNGRTAVGRRNDALSDHRCALLGNRLGGQPDAVSGQTLTAFNPVSGLEVMSVSGRPSSKPSLLLIERVRGAL